VNQSSSPETKSAGTFCSSSPTALIVFQPTRIQNVREVKDQHPQHSLEMGGFSFVCMQAARASSMYVL
jgi:hypothetical protein